MSAQIFTDDVLFAQRLWSCSGLYAGALDGDWGPKTQAASDAFDSFYKKTRTDLGEFDPRSEGIIQTLLPAAQVLCRKFMSAVISEKWVIKLLSGTRSYAEQDRLFEKVPRVTKARGGQSNHNFGIAWDIGIFVNGVYYTGRNSKEDRAYKDVAAIAKKAVPRLEWGGDWSSFKDLPHYQLATGKSVSECRRLLEIGKPYV